jgi:hypothetical protein
MRWAYPDIGACPPFFIDPADLPLDNQQVLPGLRVATEPIEAALMAIDRFTATMGETLMLKNSVCWTTAMFWTAVL